MAKFNENHCDLSMFKASDYRYAGMLLQALLSDEDYKKLHDDWHKKYGGEHYKKYPYWKYCLDKIQVVYKGE